MAVENIRRTFSLKIVKLLKSAPHYFIGAPKGIACAQPAMATSVKLRRAMPPLPA